MTNRRSQSVLGTTSRQALWLVCAEWKSVRRARELLDYSQSFEESEGQEAERLHNLFDQCMFYVSVDCGGLGGKASRLTSNFI